MLVPVQDAQKIKFIDPKCQLRVLLHALVLPVHVFLVLEVDENIILHQQAPIQTSLIVYHSLEVLITSKCNL